MRIREVREQQNIIEHSFCCAKGEFTFRQNIQSWTKSVQESSFRKGVYL